MRLLVVEVRAQAGNEVVAIGEAGQWIAVRFPAHGFQPCRLLLEHRLEATHGGVHGGGQLAQFRHPGLGDGDEAPLGDRLGLIDHRPERLVSRRSTMEPRKPPTSPAAASAPTISQTLFHNAR